MSKLFFLIVLLASYTIFANDPFLPKHSNWELTFSDEFNDNKIDIEKWHVYNSPMNRNYMIGRYSENIQVENGMLKLITKQPDKNHLKFTAGFIKSKIFTQKYGFFAARIRYAKASGLNNAFWLVTEKQPKSESFEIDINEGHYPNEIVTTIHTWTKTGEIKSISSKYYPEKINLSEDFYVYGCEWSPEEINIYFDGKKIYEGKNIKCHLPVPVLFSTAVTLFSGEATGQLDGTSMDIDWVRIYKRIPHAPKISNSKLTITADKCLTWSSADDDITPQGKITYKIYLSEKADDANSPSGIKIGETNGATELDLTQIPTNKKYYINVFAFNEAGDCSSYDTCFVQFVSNNKNIPEPGKQGVIDIIAPAWDKINISWNPASCKSSGPSELKYLVYISDKNNIEDSDSAFKNGQLCNILKGKSFCSIDGLKSGQNLWVNIVAIGPDGSRNNYKMTPVKMPINSSPPFVHYTFTNPDNLGEDSSGNNFQAINHDVKVIQDMERYSSVAKFDGKNSFLTIPPLNMASNSATISAWVKIPSKQRDYAGIVFSRRETAGLWFSNGTLGYRWAGGCPFSWHTPFKPPVNKWFQLIVVVKPDEATVYMRKDGKLYSASYPNASHQKCGLNFLEIGRDSHETKIGIIRYFKGLIDDIKIYNRALSLDEIEKLE